MYHQLLNMQAIANANYRYSLDMKSAASEAVRQILESRIDARTNAPTHQRSKEHCMNQTFKNWLIAPLCIAAPTGVIHLLDGPSADEVETAQAADLADAQTVAQAQAQAQAQARHVAGLTRKCHQLRSPTAELMQARGTDHYVCREGRIEPTPAAVTHRYALLGSGE